jgi:hypothetical protein
MTLQTSRDKFRLEWFTKDDGHRWVRVVFSSCNLTWVPSLADLWRILKAVGICEDEKYPPPKQGRYKFARFVFDAATGSSFEELQQKHRIPDRDAAGRVIDAHGANLTGNLFR